MALVPANEVKVEGSDTLPKSSQLVSSPGSQCSKPPELSDSPCAHVPTSWEPFHPGRSLAFFKIPQEVGGEGARGIWDDSLIPVGTGGDSGLDVLGLWCWGHAGGAAQQAGQG